MIRVGRRPSEIDMHLGWDTEQVSNQLRAKERQMSDLDVAEIWRPRPIAEGRLGASVRAFSFLGGCEILADQFTYLSPCTFRDALRAFLGSLHPKDRHRLSAARCTRSP